MRGRGSVACSVIVRETRGPIRLRASTDFNRNGQEKSLPRVTSFFSELAPSLGFAAPESTFLSPASLAAGAGSEAPASVFSVVGGEVGAGAVASLSAAGDFAGDDSSAMAGKCVEAAGSSR